MVAKLPWIVAVGLLVAGARTPACPGELPTRNGWYLHGSDVIWGYAQYNGWWGAYRANITRNAPGEVGPNRTEDLDLLTDAMLRYGYPALEHNFGLWYDRRRDSHDTGRRGDDRAVGPFLEQPWGRSGQGTAWDGLSRYDLTTYNEWYFARLKEFAGLCDRKGTILFHDFYMQHALLETEAHYVDFPWRPVNCIQETGLPDRIPAANAFYDVSHPLRRRLHEAYIRKCLGVLGSNTNVIFNLSQEYTGPLSFMTFWLDTVLAWERETGRDVHVCVGACKDVLDAVLADPARGPKVSSLDLRYWWYEPDGAVHAPPGGKEVAGRYASGAQVARTTPEMIYRQVVEVRRRYPDKGIIHMVNASREQTWAFLMAGGSLLARYLEYADKEEKRYVAPAGVEGITGAYRLVRKKLRATLPAMRPAGLTSDPDRNWCLAAPGRAYLVYALKGGGFTLDLSGDTGSFRVRWVDPRTGRLSDAKGGNGSPSDAKGGSARAGGTLAFEAPGPGDRALCLTRD